jgi:hypothetical protein
MVPHKLCRRTIRSAPNTIVGLSFHAGFPVTRHAIRLKRRLSASSLGRNQWTLQVASAGCSLQIDPVRLPVNHPILLMDVYKPGVGDAKVLGAPGL